LWKKFLYPIKIQDLELEINGSGKKLSNDNFYYLTLYIDKVKLFNVCQLRILSWIWKTFGLNQNLRKIAIWMSKNCQWQFFWKNEHFWQFFWKKNVKFWAIFWHSNGNPTEGQVWTIHQVEMCLLKQKLRSLVSQVNIGSRNSGLSWTT